MSARQKRPDGGLGAGGISMTTIAYAAVARDGLTSPHQMHMHANVVPHLRVLTDAVHREGATACRQITHARSFTMMRHEYPPSWLIGSRTPPEHPAFTSVAKQSGAVRRTALTCNAASPHDGAGIIFRWPFRLSERRKNLHPVGHFPFMRTIRAAYQCMENAKLKQAIDHVHPPRRSRPESVIFSPVRRRFKVVSSVIFTCKCGTKK